MSRRLTGEALSLIEAIFRLLLKPLADGLESILRGIDRSEKRTAMTPPENPFIPVVGKRFESWFYDSTSSQKQLRFEVWMNKIVVFAILTLVLEFVLNAFVNLFAFINIIILAVFISEFLIRLNYRRARYFWTWGFWVDGPIIVIESILLYAYFFMPDQAQILADLNITGKDTVYGPHLSPSSNWLEGLAAWKVLRLARFLRILKIFKDIARRPEVWWLRGRAILAWLNAIFVTLMIFMVISIVLITLTRVFTDEDPEALIRAFWGNLLVNLQADQNTGVKNSEVLRAVYQVFTILSSMIVVTLFAQLLLPIASRIKATHQEKTENLGRKHHVIIGVADEDSVGLIEEALQIWAIYEKYEVVLIIPEGIDVSETTHPSYKPDIVHGPIYSLSSWLAADAGGADQIVLLSQKNVEPAALATFLPALSDQVKKRGVLLLISNAKTAFEIKYDHSDIRYAKLGVEPLKAAIEEAISSRGSIQHRFTVQLNEKFDKATSILGDEGFAGEPIETVAALEALLNNDPKKPVAKVTEVSGTVLVDILNDPGEEAEGGVIQKLRDFVDDNHKTAPILVFVGALHLVGVNAQLGNDSQLRVVPIELLVMYAAYHETVCPGIARAWVLPPDALLERTELSLLDATFGLTTYRNREELMKTVGDDLNGGEIIGVLRANEGGFRGYLTHTLDSLKLRKGDSIVIVNGPENAPL